LAAGFFVTSLALSWWASFQRHPASIINTGGPASQTAPSGAGGQPGTGGGVLDQLQKGIPSLPAGSGSASGTQPAPAPSGPEVPQSR
jgi:preprotein translocase subunit SecG